MTQGLMIVLFVAAAFDLLTAAVFGGLAVLYPFMAAMDPDPDAPPMWAMLWLFGGLALGTGCFGACKVYAGWLVKRGEGFGAVTVANWMTLGFGVLSCNMIHLGLGIAGLVLQNKEEVRAELEGWADPA